jgi:hypothetical protein
MSNQADFMEEIRQLPVLDTHTHLIGDRLAARDFWEIAHYFWLFRELQAGGYPDEPMELPENRRIDAFLEAYHATRTTMMNWSFTAIFQDLYGIRIYDQASIRHAIEAVRHSHSQAQSGWAQKVADQMNIRRFVVNYSEHSRFESMREDAILIPRIDGLLGRWVEEISEASSPSDAYEQLTHETLHPLIDSYRANGSPGIMTTLPRLASSANRIHSYKPGASKDELRMALLHEIGAAAERNGMLVQLFLGVERSWCGTAFPANDTERILKLTGLFERYSCPFELVVASELNNLDVVQAAWNFPNVHIGGHWWFNFRASTYRDSMQYRLEALPSSKSSLIVSDARCMEWSYGKIALVKRLTGEFLWNQMTAGWVDSEIAIKTAEDWLYRSAAQRYGI